MLYLVAATVGTGNPAFLMVCERQNLREVIKVVDRPQDIDNEEAMSFFGGQEGDAEQSQG